MFSLAQALAEELILAIQPRIPFGEEMMNQPWKYAILVLCMLGLLACISSAVQSTPVPIPDRELVYMRWEPVESEWTSTRKQLGFVNADGSGLEIIEAKSVVEKPIWSSDGMFLYGLSKLGIGYPAYWDKAQDSYGLCDKNLPYYFQIQGTDNGVNPYEVLLHNARRIVLMDLAECREIRRLVDYEAPPAHYNYEIEGFSYYAPRQELVFSLVIDPIENPHIQMMHLDVKSGQQTPLTGEGIHPAWSPDGTQIAYAGWDGIYIALSDGSEALKVVALQVFDLHKTGRTWMNTAIPRWSPDGEWLAYHICTDERCTIENIEIYRIRISGGDPERILIGGKYPSWRP